MPDKSEHCFCLPEVFESASPPTAILFHYQNKLVPLEKLANVVSLSVVIAEVLVAIFVTLVAMPVALVAISATFVAMSVSLEVIFEVLVAICDIGKCQSHWLHSDVWQCRIIRGNI